MKRKYESLKQAIYNAMRIGLQQSSFSAALSQIAIYLMSTDKYFGYEVSTVVLEIARKTKEAPIGSSIHSVPLYELIGRTYSNAN